MVTKGGNGAALEGWLATVDTDAARALTELARTLADAVDADPSNAALAREYRMTIAQLTETVGANDGEESPLAKMRAAMGNAKDAKPKKPRAGGSGGSRSARSAADAVATPSRGRRPRAPR